LLDGIIFNNPFPSNSSHDFKSSSTLQNELEVTQCYNNAKIATSIYSCCIY